LSALVNSAPSKSGSAIFAKRMLAEHPAIEWTTWHQFSTGLFIFFGSFAVLAVAAAITVSDKA
jgi:hypothetical protein